MKRIVDIGISILLIFIFLIPAILIAIGIKISSKGPLFYKGLRVKKNFEPFYCYKFRTMYNNAEQRLAQTLQNNPEAFKEWSTYQKLKKDPRVTFFGSFLRRTSLDELPQLFHVLKGEMSLVGPRPYAIFGPPTHYKNELYALYGKEIDQILNLKPGLTGLWQISGRNLLPVKKRVELDLEYAKAQTLQLDLKILIKTIPEMFFSKGAF